MRRRRLLAGLPLAALLPAPHAQQIETIQLRHRTAEDVLPHLRAFLEPGGALTGQGYQLFVRASATNVRQLKQLLLTLDRAPRQLAITVRQDRADERATRTVGADGSVTVTTRRVIGNAHAQADDSRTVGTADATQTIRVLEGGRAYIAFGASIPLSFRRWVVDPNGVTEARGTVFYEAITGFEVRPRLAGDLVILELAPEQSSAAPYAAELAQLSTTVRGRLGEWIAVGDADARDEARADGVAGAASAGSSTQRGVWLKVEALDSPR